MSELAAAAVDRSRPLGKLVIVGVGLIGGSCALALREAGAAAEIVGVGRTRANLATASGRGIIDRGYALDEPWHQELHDADVVLLATPVGELPALFQRIAPWLGPATLVTDAGSTKQDVIRGARAGLGAAFARFVPGHPIAGTEHTGAAAAFAELYRGRKVVLTPVAETEAAATARIAALWTACGARVRLLAAAAHDQVFAAVSHLPHVLAFTLVDELALRDEAALFFEFAASGFRDFTRIAAGSPEMWRDIVLANRDAILAEIADYRRHLDRLEAQVRAGDAEGVLAMFARASAARRAWAQDAGSQPSVADGSRSV